MNREYGIEAATVYDNKFWYFSMDFNMLFCLDLDSGKTKNLGRIECEEEKARLFINIINYKNLLILIPMAAEHLVVYDTAKEMVIKAIKIVPPRKHKKNYDKNLKWESSTIVGNKIFMFGCTHTAIGIFDCDNLELEYDEKWLDYCNLKIPSANFRWFAKQNIVCGDSIFVSSAFGGYVYKYSDSSCMKQYTLDCGYPIYKIGLDENGFFAMSIYGAHFLRFNGDWEITNDTNLPDKFHSATPVKMGNVIYINSLNDNIVLRVNGDSKMCEDKEKESLGPMFYFEKCNTGYVCYSNIKRKIVLMNEDFEIIKEYEVLYDNAVKRFYKKLYSENNYSYIRYENSGVDIKDLLFLISQDV